jgi:hypothetical protein
LKYKKRFNYHGSGKFRIPQRRQRRQKPVVSTETKTKPGPGRPKKPKDEKFIVTPVSIPQELYKFAMEIGENSLSRGVQIAIANAMEEIRKSNQKSQMV